jgi:hypothetical protein
MDLILEPTKAWRGVRTFVWFLLWLTLVSWAFVTLGMGLAWLLW